MARWHRKRRAWARTRAEGLAFPGSLALLRCSRTGQRRRPRGATAGGGMAVLQSAVGSPRHTHVAQARHRPWPSIATAVRSCTSSATRLTGSASPSAPSTSRRRPGPPRCPAPCPRLEAAPGRRREERHRVLDGVAVRQIVHPLHRPLALRLAADDRRVPQLLQRSRDQLRARRRLVVDEHRDGLAQSPPGSSWARWSPPCRAWSATPPSSPRARSRPPSRPRRRTSPPGCGACRTPARARPSRPESASASCSSCGVFELKPGMRHVADVAVRRACGSPDRRRPSGARAGRSRACRRAGCSASPSRPPCRGCRSPRRAA